MPNQLHPQAGRAPHTSIAALALLVACGTDGSAGELDSGSRPDSGSRQDSGLTEDSGWTQDARAMDGAATGDGDAPLDGQSSDAPLGVGQDAASSPTQCMVGKDDADGDGFTQAQGDCRDCDPAVNPAAYDAPGNGIDEDCDGTNDNEPTACETGLRVDDNDAVAAAKAMGLCKMQRGSSWGLVSAKYVFPDGTNAALKETTCTTGLAPFPLSHGILDRFGDAIKPRQGAALVALSTGIARPGLVPVEEKDGMYGTSPTSAVICRLSLAPTGFPRDSTGCPGVVTSKMPEITDGMALELSIKVPSNAYALQYDFDFYSTEYPAFVCSGRNDHFVALLWSTHSKTPADKNISFDEAGNVVNVNSSFMRVCSPTSHDGRTFPCPSGEAELLGTGFDQRYDWSDMTKYLGGGATGWLTTTAQVVPGETIKLRFAVWDMDTPILDSTVLLDHFRWLIREPSKPPVATAPMTEIVLL